MLFYNLKLCQNRKSDPTLHGPSLEEDSWGGAQGGRGEAGKGKGFTFPPRPLVRVPAQHVHVQNPVKLKRERTVRMVPRAPEQGYQTFPATSGPTQAASGWPGTAPPGCSAPPIHGSHAPPAGQAGHCPPHSAQPSELLHCAR